MIFRRCNPDITSLQTGPIRRSLRVLQPRPPDADDSASARAGTLANCTAEVIRYAADSRTHAATSRFALRARNAAAAGQVKETLWPALCKVWMLLLQRRAKLPGM